MIRQNSGLKIYDACGDGDLAERQLNALFPELMDGDDESDNSGSDCDMGEQSPMVGLVDFVGLTDEPEIREQLKSFSIPFMAVRLDDFLPADEVAEVNFENKLKHVFRWNAQFKVKSKYQKSHLGGLDLRMSNS